MKSLLATLCLSLALVSTNVSAFNLDQVSYTGSVNGEVRREAVVIFNKIEAEEDAYYAFVAEYLNPWREKNFVRKFLRGSPENGYLTELFAWSTIVKFERIAGTRSYAIYDLKVENGEVVTGDLLNVEEYNYKLGFFDERPALFSHLKLPIGDETVSLVLNSPRRYTLLGVLESSWEYEYTPGPYNPGYQDDREVILSLDSEFSSITNSSIATFDVEVLNEKPLEVKGEFEIIEAEKGMFSFVSLEGQEGLVGADKVEDKIGVFIDVYNFQPLFDTFEFILVDPQNPFGGQMYFEQYGNATEVCDPETEVCED